MLKLKNIAKYYRSEKKVTQALHQVNLTFERGEFVAVVGESGSGKSTLMNVLSGLDTYEEGELLINDKETSYYSQSDWEQYRKQYIGFIFQNFNIIDAYTVYDNIYLALTIQGYDKDKRDARTLELIEKVGLTSHKNHKASKLSGGQKQRVSIARALAKDAPIIIADEPTGNLDSETAKTILALLKDIAQDKLVILVTHSFERVKDYSTRMIRLFDGQVVEDKTLSEYKKTDEAVSFKKYDLSFIEQIKLAVKNLFSMPKKTLLVFGMSLFVVAAFILTYGLFIQQSYEISGERHPYFRNVSKHRVVVSKSDLSAFNESDLQSLLAFDEVRAVVTHDQIFDMNAQIYVENPRHVLEYWQSFELLHVNGLMKRDLKEGRYPENKDEIVMAQTSSFNIGDRVDILLGERRAAGNPPRQFEIVGFTREATTLAQQRKVYFHEDLFHDSILIKEATFNYNNLLFETEDWLYRIRPGVVVFDDEIALNEVIIVPGILNNYIQSFDEPPLSDAEFLGHTFSLSAISNFSSQHVIEDVTINRMINPIEAQFFPGIFGIHPDMLDVILDFEPYQITLIVQDAFDAYQLINQMDTVTYDPVFPGDLEGDPSERIVMQFLQGAASLLLLGILYFVTYFTLKNVILSRKKDFVIFRSIGASKGALNQMVIIELMIMMTLAFMTVYLVLFMNNVFELWLPNYLRYFSLLNYAYMMIALLLLSVVLGRKFNKKIFKTSIISAFSSQAE